MSQGTRGKWAEKELKKKFNVYKGWSSFEYERLPDARAGSFQRALADFLVLSRGQLWLMEVKEVDHDYRLPYKNFEVEQVATLRAWQMAGANVRVLICHRPGARTAKWRSFSLESFLQRNATTPSGSWDLTEYPTTDLDSALVELFGPKPEIRKC